MSKKIRNILLLTVFSVLVFSSNAYASIEDVESYFSENDGNGGYYIFDEYSPYDGMRILKVIRVTDGTAEEVDRANYINNNLELFRYIGEQEWYDYTYVYEESYISGSGKPASMSIYDYKNDILNEFSIDGVSCITRKISTNEEIVVNGEPEENDEESVELNEDDSEKEETLSETLGQKNALASAHSYLNYTSFSYSGLIKQLEFSGFTNDEAVYAADNCGADWNEQAAKSAKQYLDYTSFSREGLISQLEYSGFTHEQAEYGVSSVGY